jgi:hypothetical protein
MKSSSISYSISLDCRLSRTRPSSPILSLLLLAGSELELLYDRRLTAKQFVLASSPLRPTTRDFFPQLNSCGNSLHVTSSLTRRYVLFFMNMLGLSSGVHFAHIACYWTFFLLHYTQVLCQSRLYRADHAYLTYLMPQRQLCHLNGGKLDHPQV